MKKLLYNNKLGIAITCFGIFSVGEWENILRLGRSFNAMHCRHGFCYYSI